MSTILVDYREDVREGLELTPHILKITNKKGIKVEKSSLPFADAAFEGRGPEGSVYVGIERKKIGDMLNCIDDARFSSHQLVGMKKLYGVRALIIEGVWKPDIPSGYLMQCVEALTWRPYRTPRMVPYAKLFRYLLGLQLSGVVIIQSRDVEHTAYNIVEMYSYFQKKWDEHTSLLEVQKLAIPTLNGKASLVRQWANCLDGVGVVYGQDAENLFKSPIKLAKADEQDWMRIPGIGIKTAKDIVRKIWGES